MNAERHRILELVAAGKISPADAEQLLDAVRKPRTTLSTTLFHPLEVLETRTALAISLAAALLALPLGLLHVVFDGALDIRFIQAPVPWPQALLHQLLAWPLTAVIFWGIARAIAKEGRLVDFLAAVGVARIPLLIAGTLLGLTGPVLLASVEGGPSFVVLAVVVLTLPLIGWFVGLLVTGMRTASGLRGGKLVFVSVGAICAAEIATKLLVWALR